MAQIEIKNLTFTYPLSNREALKNINLTIESGDFVVLCGKSGCGKTTLLRLLKNSISPKGKLSGSILIDGNDIINLPPFEDATKIGFVMQNPDNQIVTDKVWHELAFGLENLGLDNETIHIRVAEMASYFGIDKWFDKNTNELSGGQKQLLNLASIMVMNPQILILDEPTSQLDPIAADNFLSTISKINEEFGITVIISEHRLEDVFQKADKVAVMEDGEIVSYSTPQEIGDNFDSQTDFVKVSAPTPMYVFSKSGIEGQCPITIREGKKWLQNINIKNTICNFSPTAVKKECAIELKNICFAYSKNDNDVLNNLNLTIPKNSIFAVLGANGAGKSTLIKVMSGIERAYRGSVKIDGVKIEKYHSSKLYKNNLAVLPQNVQALFVGSTVRQDLETVNKDEIDEICSLTNITHILNSHPFDISGGEQQRVALAKVLLTNPKILIADEPTKGMDSEYKLEFAKILNSLKEKGCTVILISHDIEFCAMYADMCALIFDGKISSVKDSHSFFCENRFYTTAANRMSRDIIKNAVTKEDLLLCIKEK